MSTHQQETAPIGTLGEQILRKQSGVDLAVLVTAQPSARERKGGNNRTAAAIPVPPKGFRFTAPTLSRPVLSVQDAAVRQQALADLEGFRAQIGPYMQDLAVIVRQIEQLGEDERQLASGDWEALQSAIAGALNAPDPLAKALATIAYASAMINTCPEGRGWVLATLKDLAEKGFLVETPKPQTDGPFRPKLGQVYVYSQLYSLAPGFSRNDEAQGVLSAISSLVSRTVAAGREYYETRRDGVIALAGPAEAQLALDQLSDPACPAGLRHLPTPPQEWRGKDGSPRFRKAGGIVVRVVRNERGAAITMVAGYGGAEYDAEKIREANVFVTPASLRSEHFQSSQRLEQAQYWAITQLHRLIRLGLEEAREQEKREAGKAAFNDACRAEREALAAKATLSADEFLGGEKAGSAVIRWVPGAFEWRKHDPVMKQTKVVRVWHLFALFERNEAGRVRVAECPPRLVEFFAGYRDFESPGVEFSELGRIGVVLRQAKRNLVRAAERAAAGEEANGNGDGAAEERAEATTN